MCYTPGGVAFGGLVSLLKSLPDILSSVRHSLAMLARSNDARRASGPAAKDWEHSNVVFGGGALGFLIGAFGWEIPWHLGPENWGGGLRLLAGTATHLGLGGAVGAAFGAILFYYIAGAAMRLGQGFGRTEHDLPLPIVGIGVLAMFLMLWLTPAFGLNFFESVVVVLFCFFFVAVSARLVGLIGTTTQPVSGMTITALMAITGCPDAAIVCSISGQAAWAWGRSILLSTTNWGLLTRPGLKSSISWWMAA